MSIASEIERLNNAKSSIKQSIINKGVNVPDVEKLDTYSTYIDQISGTCPPPTIDTGGMFTGNTVAIVWKDAPQEDRTFVYKSNKYNINISGLEGEATITGNGTKEVTVTVNTNSSGSQIQIPYYITCSDMSNTYTYTANLCYYGYEIQNKCLIAIKGINDYDISVYEYNQLPIFSSQTGYVTLNGIRAYTHQIVGFSFGNLEIFSTGNYFLANCFSFNQPLKLSNNITSIGNNFLYNCKGFNQPLDINNVRSIGDYFLSLCYSFNQPINLDKITSIGAGFLRLCESFNQPLNFSDNITFFDNSGLLYGASSFNQPLSIPLHVGGLGDVMIGDSFLDGAVSFNNKIEFRKNSPTSIGSIFLGSCTAFNQDFTIPSTVREIGDSFMASCYAFNKTLTIPSGVREIGNSFMAHCYSFTKLIVDNNTVNMAASNYTLSQSVNTKTSVYGTGIKVEGIGADRIKSAFPDRTSSPYRKLV